ncbi:hypothetical protein G7Y41_03625 [Schaalia sp. ZJ405]|uniref:hypothetical protein n=1 Tax=Schaalia sp. ZJ405 TaxID=2709403 RepID=UPI0018CB6FBB|nr:hypothetical protein [Schaalia sp. ZJ405]QPK81917.1 hypothetical protein G7Y41_03625 [Schaalia sp. ZJ405]
MHSIRSYTIAAITLPVNLLAIILPFLVVPLHVALAAVGAEVNGARVTANAGSTLPLVSYLVLLSASWVSATNRNKFDKEIMILSYRNRTHYVLLLPSLWAFCFGLFCWGVSSLEQLALSGSGVPWGLESDVLMALECATMALLGSAIGGLANNGAVAVATVVLYSILVAPVTERLAPFVTARGIVNRVQDALGGSLSWTSQLLDIGFFFVVSFLVFILVTIIEKRKLKYVKSR